MLGIYKSNRFWRYQWIETMIYAYQKNFYSTILNQNKEQGVLTVDLNIFRLYYIATTYLSCIFELSQNLR